MIRNLLASPWVIVPAALGAVSLLIGLGMGEPVGSFSILGIGGILLGLGAATTRLFGRSDDKHASEGPRPEAGQAGRAYLRRMLWRIRDDDDPRTDRLLKDLMRMNKRMIRLGVTEPGGGSEVVEEVRDQAAELFRCCLVSLERTLVLHQAAAEMATPEVREQMLAKREQLVDEVSSSVAHLGATLDHLHSLELKRSQPEEELAQMRDELEMGLEVAKRVEQQMDRLERELEPHRVAREPDGGRPPTP